MNSIWPQEIYFYLVIILVTGAAPYMVLASKFLQNLLRKMVLNYLNLHFHSNFLLNVPHEPKF